MNDEDIKAMQEELAEWMINGSTEKLCAILREILDLIRAEKRPPRNNRP